MRGSSRVRKLLGLAAISIAIGAILVGLLIAMVARVPIPQRSGRARLATLGAPAEVRFDRRMIPHVRAATEEDAYRVLGWLHAGDRLLQMELRRRASAGRVAEILGSAAVDYDAGARRRAAMGGGVEAELAKLPERLRRMLDAYADGVNAYVAAHARPWELVVLGVEPEPWTALDCLRTGRVISSSVTDSETIESFRLSAALRIGTGPLLRLVDAVEEIPTLVPPGFPYEAPRHAAGGAPEPTPGGGSNAWALSGARTASGRPLLASDPHLPPEMPGVWYAAHLTSQDGLDVAGLTLAGTPGVILGHNGGAAWGLTMTQADDADLFVERRSDTIAAGEIRTERIRVKGGEDVEVRLLRGVHGPIVEERDDDLVLSLAWATALSSGSTEAFLLAARAREPEEIAAAWRGYGGPPVNVCWATASGHIGVLVAGAIPKRRSGDGRLPSPGWDPERGWEGLVPSAELPRIEEPPEGFVATANDDWSAAGRKLPFPGDYAGRERVDRIRSVLSATGKATADSMRELQGDVLSLYALRVKRALVTIDLRDARARQARDILIAWDGRCTRRGPVRLFEAFLVDLRRRVFSGREAREEVSLPVGLELLARMIEGSGHDLWDDPGTPPVEAREESVAAALVSALDGVEREDGKVEAAWNWGRAHVLTYRHLFSGASATLGRFLDEGPIELAGDATTVAVSAFSLRAGTYAVRHIPSARLVVDLSDLDRSRIVLPLGQSGHLTDPHAIDQVDAWASGRDYPFPFSTPAVDAASVAVLRLDR